MYGVQRPKYFNERDRRLKDNEEDRLLQAAREEDRLRCREKAIRDIMQPARTEAQGILQAWTRKRHLATARRAAEASVESSPLVVIPLFEGIITFLLATAARRGEALSLTWTNTHLDQMTAFFPRTKNGTPRSAPLRRHIIDLLQKLPQNTPNVFPISVATLKKAWYRICERAGIEDFHLHDLRHHSISHIAEVGYASGRPFDIVTLAAITGHRDVRMLARYARMCAGEIAQRLDEAFDIAQSRKRIHKGRPAIRAINQTREPQPATRHDDAIANAVNSPISGDVTTSGTSMGNSKMTNVVPFKRRVY